MSEWVRARSRVLLASVALAAVSCGETNSMVPAASDGGGGGAAGSAPGGSSGAGGSAAQTATPLFWSADGFIAKDSNPFGIQGPFYSYSDCDPPSGLPCTTPDPSLTGADGKPGWSVSASGACLKGTAVKVQDMMFAAQWGAGLALDLNSEGGEPGAPAVKRSFDLSGAAIRGFSVDISGSAPARIRINLTMRGVADSSFVDALVPSTTTFAVADAKQGSWVMSKTPLDPSQVEAIQFQVFTSGGSPTPFDFCVNAIRVLSEAATTP